MDIDNKTREMKTEELPDVIKPNTISKHQGSKKKFNFKKAKAKMKMAKASRKKNRHG